MRQKHPAALYVLFFTEMWERFGFYCMAALFVLYMTECSFPFLNENFSQINGLYLGFVYFTPFFGGILADRLWGCQRTVLVGAVVMGTGYALLAIEGLTTFFAGLVFIVVGNGLFKPNISTLVGRIYPLNDKRVDAGFTIFYMGINIGAFAAPLVAQYLRKEYGYPAGFAVASLGMVISLITFLLFRHIVTAAEKEAAAVRLSGEPVGVASQPEVPPELQARRHQALLIIFFVVAIFWMGFKQNAGTFNLWARDSTDRMPSATTLSVMQTVGADKLVLDKQGAFTPELFASVNPFFVVLLSPVLVWFWSWLRTRKLEPSTPAKVGIGMVLAALAFLILMCAGWAGGDAGVVRGSAKMNWAYLAVGVFDPMGGMAYLLGQGLASSEVGRVSMWWLFSAYFVITLAELCLSPMGLSLVSKLAAPSQRSTWMGGWFAATSVGGYLSGLIGGYWYRMPHSQFFGILMGTSLGAAFILVLLYNRVQSAMPVAEEKKAT